MSDLPSRPDAAASRSRGRRLGAALLCLVAALALPAALTNPAQGESPRALSQSWVAARTGTSAGSGGGGGTTAAAAAAAAGGVSQTSIAAVQQSLADMRKAARAISAQQAVQSQQRGNALAAASTVPNGLTAGGLQPAASTWLNATLPTQTVANGRTAVTVKQTAAKAIATWTSFNVGASTDLTFDQSAGGGSASSWVVLNRVTDPTASPSRILGSIGAVGQVYVINPNGVIFGGGSQVNTRALIASTADFAGGNAGFLANGIYSSNGTVAAFGGSLATDAPAGSAVVVEPGAEITTNAASAVVDSGGFVLLMGSQVTNGGSITAANGQVVLAAGPRFAVLPGYGTTGSGDPLATTLGLQIAPLNSGSANIALNTGLLEAPSGDITMVGHAVQQAGVILATTTVDQRGTIHLLTPVDDTTATVTLAAGSVTDVAPDLTSSATALNSQRAALIATSATDNKLRLTTTAPLNDVVYSSDQLESSRIEITAGGQVRFQSGSLTMAQGGQIAVAAGPPAAVAAGTGRGGIVVASGATLDVSGVPDVALPMSANVVEVNVQAFELRDSPANRDSQALANSNVYVDARDLTLVAASSAYSTDRYYTTGGLLEVSGYLANVGHSISEWTASGGTITLSAASVQARAGSIVNIAGGSIAYAAGLVKTTWLTGSDGNIYNVSTASADLLYTGVYAGFVDSHTKWGTSTTYTSPLVGATEIAKSAYTVGRDAGRLVISAPTVRFAATLDAGVVNGEQQNAAPSSVTDPYLQPQSAAAVAGALDIGRYDASGQLAGIFTSATATSAVLGSGAAAGRDVTWLSASLLSSASLASLSVTVAGSITLEAPIQLAAGGDLNLIAATTRIDADITAPGATVTIGNKLTGGDATLTYLETSNGAASVTLAPGVRIDASGLWTNALLDPTTIAGAAFANGGSVTLDSSQALRLGAGSVIDVSGGGAVSASGVLSGGQGGSVTLIGDDPAAATTPAHKQVRLAGVTLIAEGTGTAGGGKLLISEPNVWIAPSVRDAATAAARAAAVAAAKAGATAQVAAEAGIKAGATVALQTLTPAFFAAGFTTYDIDGVQGLTVLPGTRLAVAAPSHIATAATLLQPGGNVAEALAAGALVTGLAPLYTPNPVTAKLVQRPGASLTLRSESDTGTGNGGTLTVGAGAALTVDPGQSVTLRAYGSIIMDGRIIAPGGAVTIVNTRYQDAVLQLPSEYQPGLTIWLGAHSVIDVAGRAVTALDQAGRPYGVVPAGGSITIGGVGGTANDGTTKTTDAQIIIRPGAVLDASGTSALIDASAGEAAGTAGMPATGLGGARLVASDGGTISLSSYTGIFPDGTLRAAAGGSSAAGGTLSLTLETPQYYYTSSTPLTASVLYPATITVAETAQSVLPADLTPASLRRAEQTGNSAIPFAQAFLGVDQFTAGGFDTLSLSSRDLILFDGNVSLTARQSITLAKAILADTRPDGSVQLAAPYVKLSGLTNTVASEDANRFSPLITNVWQPPTAIGSGTFTVTADLIDVQNDVRFGTDATITPPGGVARGFDYTAFATVSLASSGDIRFLAASASTQSGNNGVGTTLWSNGNILLTAAQIYPASGAVAVVAAGYDATQAASGNPLAGNYTLTIARAPGTDPAAPLSAGGVLALVGPTVIQGGVVRAPLGSVILGSSGEGETALDLGSNAVTSAVILASGSITSVSAYGLTIPYGGTSDTVTYSYDGASVWNTTTGAAAVTFAPTLTLAGQSLTAQAGAVLDLRGGGTLTGEGFVSGRGGSTDVLATPLLQFTSGSLVAPKATLTTDPVYAVIVGAQSGYAPVTKLDTASGTYGAGPLVGEQITLTTSVDGLPAGTYTLLPAYYALLPGGYRIELATTGKVTTSAAVSVGNGTWRVAGTLGTANTTIQSQLLPVYVTAGTAVRAYSRYNEESYSDFLVAQATILGHNRPLLPIDAGTLVLSYPASAGSNALAFDGTALFAAASASIDGQTLTGYAGTLEVSGASLTGNNQLAITGPGGAAPAGTVGLDAGALDRIGAARMVIGGTITYNVALTQPLIQLTATSYSVEVMDGAVLTAPEVLLLAKALNGNNGAVTLDAGARIDTAAAGAPPYDSTSTGLTYDPQRYTLLAVSNGQIVLAANPNGNAGSSGKLTIADGATVLSRGSIVGYTEAAVDIGGLADLGTAALTLSVTSVNIGGASALAAAQVPAGLTLSQTLLDRLLAGDSASGVPALQSLLLTASQSVNFYGTVNLSTLNPATGQSSLGELVLETPAIYGYGSATDVATLTTGTLVWNGISATNATLGTTGSALPPGVITNGPGSGQGRLQIIADEIVLGYPTGVQPTNAATLDRTIFGFASVELTAGSEIKFNNQGSLSVYAGGQNFTSGGGVTGSGGNLTLTTALLTGASGATAAITAGGALVVQAPTGAAPVIAAQAGLGATLTLTGASVSAATTIALNAGSLTIAATTGDVTLAAGARLDASAPAITLVDQTSASPGGTVSLTSRNGDVTMAPAAVIDVSSAGAAAGSLAVTAANGTASLEGTLLGSGGTGLAGGSLTLNALALPDFAALNTRLDAGGFFAGRSFAIGSGDLTLAAGTTLRAQSVSLAVSGGSLTVNGTIDASGTAPGSIRLSAMHDLTLGATALLDAHAITVQVDSTGAAIDAANRADVQLTARTGTLTLQPGAVIDVRAAGGLTLGTVELYAPRQGNGIAVSGPGATILGASSIALYGMTTLTPAGGIVDQALLDAAGVTDAAFITAASPGLQSWGAAYGSVFHLRPGLEIDSTGDLTVSGDLNLATLRTAALDGTAGAEPGALVLRASGTLYVFGSITDGFGTPTASTATTGDGWVLLSGTEPLGQSITLPGAVLLAKGTVFPNTTTQTLNYAITIASANLQPDVVIPTQVTLAGDVTVPAGGMVATANIQSQTGQVLFAKGTIIPGGTTIASGSILDAGSVLPVRISVANTIWPANGAIPTQVTLATALRLTAAMTARADILSASGQVLFAAGATIPAKTTLAAGTILDAGSVLPVKVAAVGLVWPAGASLSAFSGRVTLAEATTVPAGGLLPAGTTVRLAGGATRIALQSASATGQPREIWATAPLLPAGSLSWSLTLVGGADLASADTRAVRADAAPGGGGAAGDIVLSDPFYANPTAALRSSLRPGISVIRTGTGDLDLLAGGSILEQSLYGIYTAGAQAADAASGTTAWYPTGGGNVLIAAQGNITGDVVLVAATSSAAAPLYQSDAVGNWLWREGGTTGEATAWSVNFGAYVSADRLSELVGFTGIGALGGGNVTVLAGADAGNLVSQVTAQTVTGALDVAVAATGRVTSVTTDGGVVTGGSVETTGGGNITIEVGGTLNPANAGLGRHGASSFQSTQFGVITDLRGSIDISAGAIGGVTPSSSTSAAGPLTYTWVSAAGGPLLALGDAQAEIDTRGTLVLGGVIDPTRATTTSGASTAFSLWDATTAIDLLSAGGTLVPTQDVTGALVGADLQIMYPPILRAVALTGDILAGGIAAASTNVGAVGPALELAPSARGQLELLAGGSVNLAAVINSDNTVVPLGVNISGAPAGPNDLPNPFRPIVSSSAKVNNVTDTLFSSSILATSLFAFEADTPAGTLHPAGGALARIYAAGGDIVDLEFGETWRFAAAGSSGTTVATWYIAAMPADIIAARDIIDAGSASLQPVASQQATGTTATLTTTQGLILNNGAADVSVLQAGQDIFHANMAIAGPGALEVMAGRNLYQADQGSLTSLGQVAGANAASRSGGASIILLAGTAANPPDWTAFADLYLNPANLADPAEPLDSTANRGKVAQTYASELSSWLADTYGFSGNSAAALAFFDALPLANRLPFLLNTVYFGELNGSGLEYYNSASSRYRTYARGQEAISALFPAGLTDQSGGITLFGGSGVSTLFGGDITALVPGGQVVLGQAGTAPPTPAAGQPAAGLITFGSGNVDVFARDSVILGQSRVFTTFGGGITIWSEQGDINAGVGAKTTQVFQPAAITYDSYGDITFSPTAPTTGAGIATLTPIAGVPAGDVILIAPVGTIDAGEAGIRASGNVILAAAVIANAANVQAGGSKSGLPTAAAPNVAAMTSSAATAAAAQAAAVQTSAARPAATGGGMPSIVTVEVLGFGEN